MSSSLVCSSKADCKKVYFSLHHCIQLSCLLTPDSFSLPALLFSHASLSSFPSTTFCPHLGSFLHQSQFILFPSVCHLSLSTLSIPLLSIHPCLFLFWLTPILSDLCQSQLPACSIKTRLPTTCKVQKLSHCPSSLHPSLKTAESSGFPLPFQLKAKNNKTASGHTRNCYFSGSMISPKAVKSSHKVYLLLVL